MQLLDEKDHDRILGPHKKVQQWIESTKSATKPHFHEVHNVLYKLKLKLSLQKSRQADGDTKSGTKAPIISKMWQKNHASYVPVTALCDQLAMSNIIYISLVLGCNCQAWIFDDEVFVVLRLKTEIAKLCR